MPGKTDLERQIQEARRRLAALERHYRALYGTPPPGVRREVSLSWQIVDFLARNGPERPSALAEVLGANAHSVRTLMGLLAKKGALRKVEPGLYAAARRRAAAKRRT